MKKKIVLAYSGGLDTSFCAVYLSRELGLEVHAVLVNTGGFSEPEIAGIRERALSLGVTEFACIDETRNFYQQVIRFLVYGNVLKNGTYPLSVSAERISQASAIAVYAKGIGAEMIAHGSTGAGNDQVRFDAVFHILLPGVRIITPIRDNKLSREDEVAYLHSCGVGISSEKAKYSVNKGIWGTSVGGKETLTSHLPLPEEAYPTAAVKSVPTTLTLEFEKGELRKVNEAVFDHPSLAIQALEKIAAPYGIGRDIHVGDTIIGIKGRVGFEAAAALITIKAHHALEKHTLTKLQMIIKDQLSIWYGNWLHEGLFLDPVMRDLEKQFESSQEKVSGKVFVELASYRFSISGVESPHDLMSDKFGSYGEMNNTWTGEDVKGFTKIMSNQVSIYHKVNQL